ncbi:coenzyme F420-0:L-glutamate ligase [Nocardioides pakistanensis]
MISCLAVTGIGEVRAGDDLAALLASGADLRDGDVLVVTSKVVSKAEGRVVRGEKAEALAAETDRVVARRGQTAIVRTRLGLVMAAAGIDASNTEPGTLVLLPADPDRSARALREALGADGPNVAVLISDTSGRAWRAGQTDIAVGAAGIEVLDDHAGRDDGYGNVLAVTVPAVADELAAAADLVTGKLSRSPAAVVRGLGHLVLPRGRHGSGAAALVRAEAQDMFGLGSREAVLQAAARQDGRGFGDPAPAEELVATLSHALPAPEATTSLASPDGVLVSLAAGTEPHLLGALEERARSVAFAHGWQAAAPDASDPGAGLRLLFSPGTP